MNLVINFIHRPSLRRELQIRVRRRIMREAASKHSEYWLSSSKRSICIHHYLYTEYIEEADIGCLPFAKYQVQSL